MFWIGLIIFVYLFEKICEYTKKMVQMDLKNFIIFIRFILLCIALSLIYLLLLYLVLTTINNEDVTFWSIVILVIIGYSLITYYEHSIDAARIGRFLNGENLRISYHFEFDFLFKIFLTPIAIPIFISTYICDWITNRIYGDETQNTTTTGKTSQTNNYTNITHKNYNTDINNYDNYFEDEYYCEMCFKKITEEEYDNFDGMCEECFEAENFDHL